LDERMNKIEIRNFNFYYGDFQALMGLNLTIPGNYSASLSVLQNRQEPKAWACGGEEKTLPQTHLC